MVTERVRYSVFICVLPFLQNIATMLILNHLRFTCLLLFSSALIGLFHCGRHTYATEITLSQGVPLETVSKMLGHTRIDTTQIYAKVTDDKIGADTQNLDKKLAERFSIVL